MLLGHEVPPLGQLQHTAKKLTRDIGIEQPARLMLKMVRSHTPCRPCPGRRTSETAGCSRDARRVALAANGEKYPHEQRAQQLFEQNRRTAGMRIALIEQHTHVGEDAINQSTQWVVLRRTLLQAHVAEHRRQPILLVAHGKSGKVRRRSVAGVCLKPAPRTEFGVSHQPARPILLKHPPCGKPHIHINVQY